MLGAIILATGSVEEDTTRPAKIASIRSVSTCMLLTITEVVPATTQLTSVEIALLAVAVVVIFGPSAYSIWLCKDIFAIIPPELVLEALLRMYPPEVIIEALHVVCAALGFVAGSMFGE